MTCISSANVACGFHAGDATVMRGTVARAMENGVAIGAHPGYPDLLGFGRRAMDVSPAEFDASLPVFTLAGSEMSDAAAKAGP